MNSTGYLDHAATSFPKAPGVPEAVASLLSDAAGNPGRGGHGLVRTATRIVESTRDALAQLLGAEAERLVFGPGATFWLNTLLSSVLARGDRVVVSALEHNAVMRPLRHLERERGLEVVVISGACGDGVPSAHEVVDQVTRARTRAVVLTHASNVSGAVLPIAEIVRAVPGTPVIVDGAQTAGSIPVDFRQLGAAAYVCSGHKGLLGPAGVGLLMFAEGFQVEPLVRGGTGSRSQSEEMPRAFPDRLEAGTPNTAGIAGLGAAVRWLAQEGVETIHRRTTRLVERLAEGLSMLPGIRLVGYDATQPRVGTLSFCCRGMDLGELVTWLDREHGLMLRGGLHCAPAAHRQLGTFPSGTLRASVGPFSSEGAVDALVEALAVAKEVL